MIASNVDNEERSGVLTSMVQTQRDLLSTSVFGAIRKYNK